jgi:hypothetical protein
MKTLLFAEVCATILFVAMHVQADVKSMQNINTDTGSYGYTFDDDPLNAGGFGPNDSTIKVRPKAARTTLIRPRTSFVPEMLKSVEDI